MADNFGVSFDPSMTTDPSKNKGNNNGLTGIQQAIQTLSYRLPKVSGAQGISPLMGQPGSQALSALAGAGQGVEAPPMGLEELLKRLFGSLGQTSLATLGAPAMQSATTAPTTTVPTQSAAPAPRFGVGLTAPAESFNWGLSTPDPPYGYPTGTAAPTSNPDGTSPDPFNPYTGYPTA